jgi:hypothetical protein
LPNFGDCENKDIYKNEKPLHQVEKLIPDTPSDHKQEIVEKTPVDTEIASVNIKDIKPMYNNGTEI